MPAVFIQSSHWFILVKYLFQFEASSLWVPISPLQSFRMKNPLDSWVNDTDKELWLACVTAEGPGAENSEVKTFVCYIFVGTAPAWTHCLCFPMAWRKYQPGYAEKKPQHFLIVAGTAAGKSGSFTSEGSAWAARPLGYFKWKTYLCCLPKGKNELQGWKHGLFHGTQKVPLYVIDSPAQTFLGIFLAFKLRKKKDTKLSVLEGF